MRSASFGLLVSVLALGCSASGSSGGSGSAAGTGVASSTASGVVGSGGASGVGGGSVATTGGGAGGDDGCTPIGLGANLDVDSEPGGSSLVFEVTGLAAANDHVLYLEFFDVAGPQKAGTYPLGVAPDDDYATCAHCALLFEDFSTMTPRPFFPESGSLTLTVPDAAFDGRSAGSLADVVFREVTLEKTTSTPVPGGRCLRLASALWDTTSK